MKIVFAEPIGVSSELLRNTKMLFNKLGHEFRFYEDRNEEPDEVIKRAKDSEILVLSNIPLSKNILEACPDLKMINVAFTGTDHIDTEFCKAQGITVCNAAGYSTNAVSELTVGMAIALLRNIVQMDANTRIPGGRNNYMGTELFGKTVGIIGTGAIGTAVAKLFVAFGCRVLAFSRTQKEIKGVEFVSPEKLLIESDIVSIHVPSNSETKNFIDARSLSYMKRSAVLINTARGAVVDYQALANMLKEGKIAGAAIDIYEVEPPLPANHPLLEAPSTILLPHIAYATKEAIMKRFDIINENIFSFMKGEVQNRVV